MTIYAWPFQLLGSIMVIGGILSILWDKFPVWAGFTLSVVGLVVSIMLSEIESIEVGKDDGEDEHGEDL
jgi:hypothetical protein